MPFQIDTKELAKHHRAIADLWDPPSGTQPVPAPPITTTLALHGARNETIGFKFDSNTPIVVGGLDSSWDVATYSVGKVTTTNPSYLGAPVGAHEDPLYEDFRPGTQWVDIKIPSTAPAGITYFDLNGTNYSLRVFDFSLPDKPSVPLLIELVSWYCYQGHYAGTDQWGEQGPITNLYYKSLKDHRVNPIRPWLSTAIGHVDMWIDDKLSHFVLPVRGVDASSMTDTKLAEAESLAKSCLANFIKPIIYLWDEPGAGALQSLPAMYQNVKQKVPSAEVMVTTIENVNPLADIYCPVFQHIGGSYPASLDYQSQNHKLWGYVSCMSHGCDYLGDSGEPDLGALERPGVYQRSFFWTGDALGCESLLYFNSVEFYKYTNRDPFQESLWDFSGNGDGTLFYPDRTNHKPIETLRLKNIRRGSFDLDYVTLARQKGIAINHMARDWKDWEKDDAVYDAEIMRLGLEIEKK